MSYARFAVALMFAILAQETSAQRLAPVAFPSGLSARQLAPSPGTASRDTARPPDTATARAPRALPFVLGGAVFGGVVGAILAASYSCSSDPAAGYYCTSTDPATGAIMGIAVGAAVGGLVWALIKYSRSARGGLSPRRA